MQNKIAFTFLKVILSIPIGIGLAYPFLSPDVSGGILGELKIFGPAGSIVALILFLGLVILYAWDLMRILQCVSVHSRTAEPRSVWFMLLLPYNFIEDFFIVSNVAKSLETESQVNSSLRRFKSFGIISGWGWCVSQIISLIPNELGSAAGIVAIGFWIWHWVFIRRANRALVSGS